MEKLNHNTVALSLGITASMLSAICWIVISILPMQTMIALSNNLFHGMDISSIATESKPFFSLIIGIIAWFLIGAMTGYIFSFIYNWIAEKS